MMEEEITELLRLGYWIQVSPLANKNSGWVCAIYKRGKKTGNWVTEHTKTVKHPILAYTWAANIIEKEKK